ncbi:MAG: ATPase [Deltaproteobacteria bacterium CG03_land_8_20_14_0_80_45_14]|nr:MAG: ATPase [Deltaproteobacteria bacterium CG03_land_8_20_14_0_80_45_14]
MNDDILRIGHVIEVDGFKTVGKLEASISDLYRTHRSRKYAVGQVGSIVKIESGDLLIFGVLTSLRMAEVEGRKDIFSGRTELTNAKWIEIELFGQGLRTGIAEAEFSFERGISTYPLPGQPIYLATVEELRRVYEKPDKATVKVGSVSRARGLPVHLILDELIGKHFAILGTTGSGKSCSVALILNAIIEQYPHAHIILLDPHNEYSNAFADRAEFIDITSLEIPHWLLNLEESIGLFVGKTEFAATSQTNILKDAILKARQEFPGGPLPTEKITVDTPVPYTLGRLIENIKTAKPSQESKAESYYKILNKINILVDDKRFSFLLAPDEGTKDNLSELITRFLRIPDACKPVSIVDLSGVPSDVVDVVVSVLCRTVFDFALWNKRRRDTPLLLVCEEAHRYAPRGEEAAFQPTKKALARIAKEGRKYGVGLALVTQRPSELSESILSQCNTIIALRMSNEQDQHFVQRALPESVRSLVDALPTLRTREALVVGEGTSVPVRMLFNRIPESRRPRSADVPFAQAWSKEISDNSIVTETVRRWREQKRD